tara:strand:- start:7192 stop:11634 length:4443 start_codon:yes stop_codon:yes gene_type:complete
MSCNTKINTKNFLIEKGIIDDRNNIKDIYDFNTVNSLLTMLTWTKYGVKIPKEGKLLGESYNKVTFNDKAFDALNIATEEFDPTLIKEAQNYIDKLGANKKNVMSTKETFIFSDVELEEAVQEFQEQTKVTKTPVEYILFGEDTPMVDKKTTPSTPLYRQGFKPGSKMYTKAWKLDVALYEKEVIKEIPANVVLDNIIKNYSNFSEDGQYFVEQAKKLLGKSNTKIALIPRDALTSISENPFTLMGYSSDYNKIYVSTDTLNGDLNTDEVISTMLHEVAHSVTVQAYFSPQTIEEEMFRDFINEQYEKYLPYKTQLDNPYGLKNQAEFIAEMVANPKFRSQIESIKIPESKTIVSKLVEWVRRIFGLTKNTKNKNIVEEILKISKPFDNSIEMPSILFEKRAPEFTEDELLIDDSTLEKRLLNTIQKLTISLDLSIKSLNKQLERTNEDENSKEQFLEDQIQILQNVQRDLGAVELSNKILAVESFTNVMIGNMEAIKTALKKVDLTDETYVLNVIKRYDKIVGAYAIIDDVQDIIAAIETDNYQDFITEKELDSLKLQAEMASGRFHGTRKTVEELTKKYMIKKLNNVKYFKEVEKKHFTKLMQQHKEAKLPGDANQWAIHKMTSPEIKKEIDADVEEAITKLINNKAWDILAADVPLNSGLNISSPLIQIMHQILTEIDEVRNKDRVKKDLEFDKLFAKLREEKGTNDIDVLYKNIYDVDSNGKTYFKGEYSSKFMSDVYQKILDIKEEYQDDIDRLTIEVNEAPVGSVEWQNKSSEYQQIIIESKAKQDAIIRANTIKLDNGKLAIKDKWKNDTSNLSAVEKEVLDFIIETNNDIQKMTYPSEGQSNIKYASRAIKNLVDGVRFYELPKVTKSDTERFFKGDFKGIVQDKINEAKNLRPDDFGYVEKMTDLSGRKIRSLKLWYRDPSGTFLNSDQSLDAMGIMRMDYINASAHQIRGQYEHEVNFLLDIAKNKEYYKKEGTIPVLSKLLKKYDITPGDNSNTVKFLENMVEAKFYDILNKGSVRIGPVDANKAVTFINSASAFLTLSLNLASGTANIVNANAQLFIESFWKGRFITASALKKANQIYGTTLGDSMKDLTRPFNKSFPNQLQEYFNTKGLFQLANADFLRTDMVKMGLSMESLRIFQETGEHYIQSVTVMAVLDTIKVMDENHNFINKDGKIVQTKKAAASILDMMKVNEIDGLISFDSKAVYTTHSKLVKWNEGGKENLDSLIAKKLYDVIGNYRASDQPDIKRVWYGKWIMLYRNFLIPMGIARLRGFGSSWTRKEDLKDHEKRFSYALQEHEEGYYTTFIRYVVTSFKDKKMYLTSKEKVWDKLSDYEKHNIKKAFVESVMTMVLLPLVVQLITSIKGKDDPEYIFFLLYQIRRLDTELSQYKSPSESFKMMRSPIPSMRLIETALSVFGDTLQPWKWGDEYQGGYNKGKSKYWTKIKKQIPLVKEYQRTYKDLFEYQNSYFGFK